MLNLRCAFRWLASAAMVAAMPVVAQTFPSKPVTLMVPYPPGGLSDTIARKINGVLAQELKQPVVIENLGGAGGSIGAQKVLSAPADGYYIFQGSPNELILTPLAVSSVKYKASDFQLVQEIASAPLAIVARKDFPANDANELVAYARKAAKDGKPVSYASVGIGSLYHLLGEAMARRVGADMLHVPYRGGAPILQDMLGGQVDMSITIYGAPHVAMAQEGKLKFVAALSEQPQRLIPRVPLVDQSPELKGFHSSNSTGFYVKSGTPVAVVQALHTALVKVMSDAELRSALTSLGLDLAAPQRLDQAAQSYAMQIKLFQQIAESIGLQPQ